MSQGRILFIDAYDSFSNNIINLLRQDLDVIVESIRIDDPRFVLNDDALHSFLSAFDAVIAGPGPGHPQIPQDIGLIDKIWTAPELYVTPALGICLGFQSLCLSEGAQISRLNEPRHGLVTRVTHHSVGMFSKCQDVLATQYHSLKACLDQEDSDHGTKAAFWQPSAACPSLIPLAWDLSDAHNGPILMAVEHVQKPFAAMQFHPESICTNHEGRRIIRTWWQQAQRWNHTNRPCARPLLQNDYASLACKVHAPVSSNNVVYNASRLPVGGSIESMAELVRSHDDTAACVVLQSGLREGQPVNPETGRFSILGLHDAYSEHIRYACATRTLVVTKKGHTVLNQVASIGEALKILETFIDDHHATGGPVDVPFWGGLIGFVSYEAGLASIEISPPEVPAGREDIWFVFIQRSLVIDHLTNTVYVQSIRSCDQAWIDQTVELLRGVDNSRSRCSQPPTSLAAPHIVSAPGRGRYCEKVLGCQSHLRAGSSYELCLTGQTTVHSGESPWHIYRRLNAMNPAPFGVYFEFADASNPAVQVTVMGSSPERFLSWSRGGKCQFRPIKGTVSKSAGVTRADAEAILRTPKEVAENLMIVDLIRHDLAGVKGVQNVQVPTLMSVEEYETVYQLVSVIEGDLTQPASGVSVLAASLPPGSMTGAPKRRSCQLLKDLEDNKSRGLYSGVIGYLDVGGGGDFSVVIRTAFKWRDEGLWHVGAGGAVTMLSTPEGEYDEMLAKRERLMEVLMSPSGNS